MAEKAQLEGELQEGGVGVCGGPSSREIQKERPTESALFRGGSFCVECVCGFFI